VPTPSATASEQQQQPGLNRIKSSKLFESLTSVATTMFKPKTKEASNSNGQIHQQSMFLPDHGAQKNVRLINPCDHDFNMVDDDCLSPHQTNDNNNFNEDHFSNNYQNYNNNNNIINQMMDVNSPPSNSNGMPVNGSSAFHNFGNKNASSNNIFTGKAIYLLYFLTVP